MPQIAHLTIKLYRSNYKRDDILRQLGISNSGLQHIIQKLRAGFSSRHKHRSGRPRKGTKRSERRLIRESKANSFLTSSEMCDQFYEISSGTTRNVLIKNGLHGVSCHTAKSTMNFVDENGVSLLRHYPG